MVAVLFVACGTVTKHTPPPDSQTRYENAALADVSTADYFASSPTVIDGEAFPRSQDASAAVGSIEIRDGRGRASMVDTAGSGLAVEPGTHVIAGTRERNGRLTLTYGRQAFLVLVGESAYRYTGPGKAEPLALTAELRCAARISPCYDRYLGRHGIVTAAERRSFAHATAEDPLLAILYFAAWHRHLVTRFPTTRCETAKWSCASSSAYRKLLRFSPVI